MKTYEIIIPKILKSISFEEILQKHYYKSKLKKNERICFNFKHCEWIDLFELNQISLWILELKNKSKTVQIILPEYKLLQDFLYNYEFINFSIDSNLLLDPQKYKKPYNPKLSPMFPLSFKDEEEFQRLLEELRDSNRAAILLRDISSAEIVRQNAIHTVILKEISENIFKH